MVGGELKFSEGIKKHFRCFTIFNYVISRNTNVLHLAVIKEKNNVIFSIFYTNIEIAEVKKKNLIVYFKYQQNSSNNNNR